MGIQGQTYGIDDLAGAFRLLPVAEDVRFCYLLLGYIEVR